MTKREGPIKVPCLGNVNFGMDHNKARTVQRHFRIRIDHPRMPSGSREHGENNIGRTIQHWRMGRKSRRDIERALKPDNAPYAA